ncbi:MAG: ABC transporter permease [Tissierellaceae bacterium]|nr:ABC transporter permease [Tissierellaceae bacterium]
MDKKQKVITTKQIETRFSFIRTLFAVAIALVIAFFLMATVSDNIVKDFTTLLIGPLANTSRMTTVISKMIPLLFTGVAVALIYSAGQINIAAEGAFFAGAVAATVVALIEGIPAPIHIVLTILAGAAAGAVVMGIPAIMHVKYDIVTIVSSLMMNYVALYGGLYIILNPLRDPSAGFEASFSFQKSAILPRVFGNDRLHLGLIIGFAVVILASILLYKRPFGYSIRTVGQNKKFANYSGIPVNKTIVLTSLLSGAIAGMGGTVETLGNYSRFIYSGFTNHGWDGIMLAVLCRNNPKTIPFAAFFLAYIKTSADALNLTSRIPPEIISIIQAIIIIFIAAERFLAKWEHKTIVANSQKTMAIEKGE